MKNITAYLDFVSPYAYLAFVHLPQALVGLSYSVTYRPVFLGALLKAHGQKAPAAIESKREWIYRQALWHADKLDIPMQMPSAHPFNVLPLLRLAVAVRGDGTMNRYVATQVLRHTWAGGGDALDAGRMAELEAALPDRVLDPQGDEVKALLRTNSESAVAAGVFGVPSFDVDGQLFWGFDGLPLLRAYLEGDAWFSSAQWREANKLPYGISLG